MSAVLPDKAARDRIVQDLKTCFLVEASAGTGKTTSLVGRMIALVASGVDVGKVAAVTFTRKAAAQLRQRFQQALEAQIREELSPELLHNLRHAQENLDRCFIGTIHSFCASILRERPVEAGVSPSFEELSEQDFELLRIEFWNGYVRKAAFDSGPEFEALKELGLEPAWLEQAFGHLCLHPEAELISGDVDAPDFSEVREILARFVEKSFPSIPESVPPMGWDNLQKIIIDTKNRLSLRSSASARGFVDLLEAANRDCGVKKSRWRKPDKEVAEKLSREFKSIQESHIIPALNSWYTYVFPRLAAFVKPAVAEFQESRRASGRLSFEDLLVICRDLLRDKPAVRRYFSERWDALLIDEFQDTDPLQAEIVFFLTGEDHDERDWQKLKPRPGSLFVVGDPKQSIYRFRRADIQIYDLVKKLLIDAGGETLELKACFRLQAPLCRWVNSVFSKKMPSVPDAYQAGYSELLASSEEIDPAANVFLLSINAPSLRHGDIARQSAEDVADLVYQAITDGWPLWDAESKETAEPSDFLILTYTKNQLNLIAQKLDARGIPCDVTGSNISDDDVELRAFIVLLNTLADPQNQVSLVSYLRGPLCGIDDNELYWFKKNGGRFNYLSPGAEVAGTPVAEAMLRLRKAYQNLQQAPPGSVIGKMLDELGLPAFAACRENGGLKAGNIVRLLAIASDLSAQGDSLTEIAAKLNEVIEKSEAECLSLNIGAGNAVRLMNLHKAKGLESKFVVLACPVPPSIKPVSVHIDRSMEFPRVAIRFMRKLGKYQSKEVARCPGWEQFEKEELRFIEAERQRLLYVAATRASKALIIADTPDAVSPGCWAGLLEASEDISELALKSVSDPGPLDANPWADTLDDVRTARNRMFEEGAKKSFIETTVTGSLRERHLEASKGQDTGGRFWGRAMHGALQMLLGNPEMDLKSLSEMFLRAEEVSLEHLPRAVQILERALDSPIWKQAQAAAKRFAEVPYCFPVKNGGELPEIVAGTMDLVFEDDGGWVIVDYKTDSVEGRMTQLLERYSPQVRAYREHWRTITGAPVRCALYFLANGQLVWVD